MFEQLMNDIDQEILSHLFRSATSLESFERFMMPDQKKQTLVHQSLDDLDSVSATGTMKNVDEPALAEEPAPEINITFRREVPKVGPNDPCPCGSGKKYKKCCGK